MDRIYVGKAKEVYQTDDEQVLWLRYLDQATALNGKKKDNIKGKGAMNNQITSHIFQFLAARGIKSHFIEAISDNEQLVEKMTMLPLECVIRNYAAGSITKRLGFTQGMAFEEPVIEFFYKNDALDDPLVNRSHIFHLKLLSPTELAHLEAELLKLNQTLVEMFAAAGLILVDFKVEYGYNAAGELLLADEISPDTCRLWDKATHQSLDKDIYRQDLGDIMPLYQEVLCRLKRL